MSTLRRPSLSLLLLFVFVAAPARAGDQGYANRHALADFLDHVNFYAAVQRTVVKSLGPPLMWPDWEQVLRQQRRYAEAMREARPGARDGAFFTPAVSRFFRDRIDAIVRETGLDVTTTFEPPDDNEIVVMARPRAGEAVPWNAGPVMWPSMLAGLPELPPELEYRFLGQHLILIDVLANLVVDVLPDALPDPEMSSS
jgi:hypothetical protein